MYSRIGRAREGKPLRGVGESGIFGRIGRYEAGELGVPWRLQVDKTIRNWHPSLLGLENQYLYQCHCSCSLLVMFVGIAHVGRRGRLTWSCHLCSNGGGEVSAAKQCDDRRFVYGRREEKRDDRFGKRSRLRISARKGVREGRRRREKSIGERGRVATP